MDRKQLWQWLIFATAILFSLYVLWPPWEKIRLGLDLQGGSSFTVQIDKEKLHEQVRERLVEANKGAEVASNDVDNAVQNALNNSDTRILEILRNRVDQLGVNEPVIAAGSNHRILIQLPGANEKTHREAEERIQSAAFLQFRLVHKASEELVRDLFDKGKAPEGYRIARVGTGNFYEPARDKKGMDELRGDPTYLRRLGMFEVPDPSYEFMLEREFAPGENGRRSATRIVYKPHFVRRKAEMAGDALKRAADEPNTMTGGQEINLELTRAGGERMAKLFNEQAGRPLAIVLDGTLYSAPVLNEKREHITGVMRGAVITGAFSLEEARRLRDVLNSGSLPAPVRIIEKHVVGSTLGQDAIDSGVRAAVVGSLLVGLFMLVYYAYCGLLADLALVLNVVLLPAGMLLVAGFLRVFISQGGAGAALLQLPVLTMPGIAGIVLTVGMAVDANVLIFERMREEFLAGKSVRAAVAAGYDRAFYAIFDSNITTVISGVIMFIFGSGPVRGYAITLCAGLLVSMYTSLVVTRMIFDATLSDSRSQAYRMMRWIKETAIDFLAARKVAIAFSVGVIAVTLAIFAWRLQTDRRHVLAVDFTGGSTLTFDYRARAPLEAVSAAAAEAGVADALSQYQTAMDGSGGVLQIKTSQDTGKDKAPIAQALTAALQQRLPDSGFRLVAEEQIGAQVSAELARDGLIAILLSLVGIIVYLTIRFEFGFALGAIVAVFHDALFTLGVYCLCGRQVSLTIVAALLTIIGYSVNDTIVIFDRIRENLKLDQRRSFAEIANWSINQTLGRTLLTNLTVFLVVLSLFFLGGGAINDFAACMLIGVVVGTYSTVYIATPVTIAWHRGRRPSKGGPAKK
jgi:SecD/SecF fusion protein